MTHIHPFWSDDFDMDLLKVIPDVLEILGPSADCTVWTLGHTSGGRLNHPTTWNTHGATVWLEKPELHREPNGWVNVLGCVTNAALVEATWLEWLRDCWAHHFNFLVLPAGELVPGPSARDFDRIMSFERGWDVHASPTASIAAAQLWLFKVNQCFIRLRTAETVVA